MMLDEIICINNITKSYKESWNPIKRIYRLIIEHKILKSLEKITNVFIRNKGTKDEFIDVNLFSPNPELFDLFMGFGHYLDCDLISITHYDSGKEFQINYTFGSWNKAIIYAKLNNDGIYKYDITLIAKDTIIHKSYNKCISMQTASTTDDQIARIQILYLLDVIFYAFKLFVEKEL